MFQFNGIGLNLTISNKVKYSYLDIVETTMYVSNSPMVSLPEVREALPSILMYIAKTLVLQNLSKFNGKLVEHETPKVSSLFRLANVEVCLIYTIAFEDRKDLINYLNYFQNIQP